MPYPATASNAAFTACSFIGFLMCTIPLPWHLEAWNTGTCLYMIWTGLYCLNQFINSIVWHQNAVNWAPVWCDISTRIIVGAAVGIPAASLCINRRLYHIASVKTVRINKADKRRDVIVDLCIGLGLPIIEMVFHYINQGHRFDIFEDVGCWPFTYDTPLAYVLVSAPPILIGLVSCYYGVRSIIAFNRCRSSFNELLSNYSNLTRNRYLRLMCLAGIEVLCTVPLSVYALYLNGSYHGTRPWISFADTHWGFKRVDQYPALLWRSNAQKEFALEASRWFCIACAVIFFVFFGFADEARKNYRACFDSITKRIGFGSLTSTRSTTSVTTSGSYTNFKSGNEKIRPALPVFVHKEMLQAGSRDSFTNVSLSIADVGGFLDEKKGAKFSPTSSYGNFTLHDVGSTLAEDSEKPFSPISSTSSGSTISIPEPALTRQSSLSTIETSIRRNSFSVPSSPISPSSPSPVDETTAQKAHTPDVV